MNAESVATCTLTIGEIEALSARRDRYQAELPLAVAGWQPEQISKLRFLKFLVTRGVS